MNVVTSIRVGAVCILFAALALVWYGYRSVSMAEVSLALVTRKHASLEISIAKIRERIAAHERDAALLVTTRKGLHARKLGASSSNQVLPNSSLLSHNFAALLEANPKLMELYLKNFRANLADRFGPAFEKIGFSPEQISKFEDLATAHEQENMDLRAAAAAQGLPMTDPGITAMRQQSNQQYQAALVAEIGASASQQLAQSPVVSPSNQAAISTLANMLALSATPMTYEEAGQLAPILANAGGNSPNGGTPASIDWNKVSEQASGVLSRPQLQALQAMASVMQVGDLVKQFYSQQSASK
jgi:hypothetical protein